MQARPPVSIQDRSGEAPAPDILDSGTEHEPRLTSAAKRRLRLGSVVIIVSIAAVVGGLEVQERRDAAAEARRLAGLPQFIAYGPYDFGAEAEPPPSRSAVLNMKFQLRNDGPRHVTVTHANAGEFVLLDPVPLPAQTSRVFVLHQNLRCSADTPPPSQPPTLDDPLQWPGPLRITAETPRGIQTVTLAEPPYYNDHAASICEWMRDGRPASVMRPATPDPA